MPFEVWDAETFTSRYTKTLHEAAALIQRHFPDATLWMGDGQGGVKAVESPGLDEALYLRAHYKETGPQGQGIMSAEMDDRVTGHQEQVAEIRWVTPTQARERQQEQAEGMER